MSTDEQESHQLLTIPEVAERLRLSRGTVYRLVREGVVPAVQLGESGSSLRVSRAELSRWLFNPVAGRHVAQGARPVVAPRSPLGADEDGAA